MALGRTSRKCITVMMAALTIFTVTIFWKQYAYITTFKNEYPHHPGTASNPSQRNERASALLRDEKTFSKGVTDEGFDNEPQPRDVMWQEKWAEVEASGSAVPDMPSALHYLWCGAERYFTFQAYLSVLSGLRVLKPLKVIFHYTHSLPAMDMYLYNDWFQELKETVPLLDLRPLTGNFSCGSKRLLESIVKIVLREGGVYLEENVILAHRLPLSPVNRTWSAARKDLASGRRLVPGILLVKHALQTVRVYGTPAIVKDTYVGDSKCVTVDTFNKEGPGEGRECIMMNHPRSLSPRDIWDTDTPFAELARWLFYGKRAIQVVEPDPTRPIPRISHFIRIQSGTGLYAEELSFPQFLGILSALHVAGFEQVYLHTDREVTGPWWEELRGENITVLKMQKPEKVFQQKVTWIKHVSDLYRYHVVSKYGGAYQDFDVVWTSYIPDSLLAYPAVISNDISGNGLWPKGLSIGLFLARQGASYLRHFVKTYRDYKESKPLYNSILMSYRTQERYPASIRVDPHLQMICFREYCHPQFKNESWIKSRVDLRVDGGKSFNWTQVHCIHVTSPKPAKSFESPASLRNGTDMFADIGRWILQRSHRMKLLDFNRKAA